MWCTLGVRATHARAPRTGALALAFVYPTVSSPIICMYMHWRFFLRVCFRSNFNDTVLFCVFSLSSYVGRRVVACVLLLAFKDTVLCAIPRLSYRTLCQYVCVFSRVLRTGHQEASRSSGQSPRQGRPECDPQGAEEIHPAIGQLMLCSALSLLLLLLLLFRFCCLPTIKCSISFNAHRSETPPEKAPKQTGEQLHTLVNFDSITCVSSVDCKRQAARVGVVSAIGI